MLLLLLRLQLFGFVEELMRAVVTVVCCVCSSVVDVILFVELAADVSGEFFAFSVGSVVLFVFCCCGVSISVLDGGIPGNVSSSSLESFSSLLSSGDMRSLLSSGEIRFLFSILSAFFYWRHIFFCNCEW